MLFCGLLLSLCGIPSLLYSQSLNATNEMNLGIAAYDSGKYHEAIEHLTRAVTLEPKMETGHLYLGRTYDNLSADSPECDEEDCAANERLKQNAMHEFRVVLELNPSNTEALKHLAHRYLRSAKRDEAEAYYRQTLIINPNDAEALYGLAVMLWKRSYVFRTERRLQLKLNPKSPLINLPACGEVRAQNLARIDESIALLTRTLQIFEAADAIGYMVLLYRERADVECNNGSAYDHDLNTARHWSDRACQAWHQTERITIPSVSMLPPPPATSEQRESCSF